MNTAGLLAVEDPGGGPDGPDATGPDGAGELEAVEFVQPLDQAGDVAGVEGIAAAGAVNVGDRIGTQADPEGVGDDDRPCSPRVTTTRLRQSLKARAWRTGSGSPRIRLASSVLGRKTSGEGGQGGGARGSRRARGWRRPGWWSPRGTGPGEPIGEGVGVEPREDQEPADVDDFRVRRQRRVEVLGDEPLVGAEGVDEPAVLPPDVDDQALAGREGVDPRAAWRRPRARPASRRRTGRRRRRPPGRRRSSGRRACSGPPPRSRRSRRC